MGHSKGRRPRPGVQRRPSVPSPPHVCKAARGAKKLLLLLGLFCFLIFIFHIVCPHFICTTRLFFCPLPCQAHRKFAGFRLRVHMLNNFISLLEGSQHGVQRAGQLWGAQLSFHFFSTPSTPPLSLHPVRLCCQHNLFNLFYFIFFFLLKGLKIMGKFS